MGQKVHPYGFRLGVTTDWKSRWFADRAEYGNFIIEDWKIRDLLMTDLPHAAISRVEVERRLSAAALVARGAQGVQGHRVRRGDRPLLLQQAAHHPLLDRIEGGEAIVGGVVHGGGR